MKKKSLILSFVCAVFGLLATFSLTGCGVSLNDLKGSFDKLDQTYQSYSEIFSHGFLAGVIDTDYVVNYGGEVNKYVSQDKENYVELREEYNVMLAISHDYIDTNKAFILNYDFSKLSGKAKDSLKNLNDSIKAYTKELKTFAERRKTMMLFFDQFAEGTRDEGAEQYQLRMFKRAYGNLVSKNIDLSTNLARSIELTEIFDLIKNTATTSTDVSIIKDYIQIKMLPIYNNFMINAISNELDWNVYVGKNAQLDNLVQSVKNSFSLYKTQIVNGGTDYKNFNSDAMSAVFDKTENFFSEEEMYSKALNEFNIANFMKKYDGNLANYTKKNKFAASDLDKMEQFITKTVQNFIGEMKEYLFN